AAPRAPAVLANDRIFVRDLVVPLAIGAYQAEHGARQRVRFCVEADVERAPVAPHDMRDVFSYDVIIETIRVLAQRPHVTFVETLAEEVAASLIAHPALAAVTVKVEKLDVIEGSVGIEITRRRPL
ncbi:MAG: dihydroneopterin aldolase, partial [Beijerinckiaceae bacterium]|nr:dihydroneopterin aldolase [Beijerinckiaceae bacterium]